jgi:hypothetical protein
MTNLLNTIIDGMARALFVQAYADAVEQGEIDVAAACMGQDWMDIAPETPKYAYNQAWRLLGKIEELNKSSIHSLHYQAYKADGINYYHDEEYARLFGHYLAMQSLGHGVSWFDDHTKFDLKLPYFEFELEDEPCVFCGGQGTIYNSYRSIPCDDCNGTGVKSYHTI